MGLLVDFVGFVKRDKIIMEGSGDDVASKKLIVEGILQRADVVNQNDRIYPKKVLVREAEKYKKIFVENNRALGELDHSDKEIVELKNVSHNILDMWWENDDLVGRIEILPTPAGNILKQLIMEGIKVGISSRATGSLNTIVRNGKKVHEIQDDLCFICWDFVSNPSTAGAFMSPVNLKESVERVARKRNDRIEKIIYDIISIGF